MPDNKKNRELKALISLLDEPDTKVFEQIRTKIYAYGTDAISVLEASWEQSFDPLLQERIEGIIHMIQQDDLLAGITSWAQLGSEDLMKGYMLAARYQYPDLDSEKVIKQVGQLVQDVWLELNSNLTALEKIKVVNHILFDVHKFRGNKSNIKSPDNLYFNILLESKKGNPLSIGILYIIIARSLKLPVYGVDLPNHFILAYMDEMNLPERQMDASALFYINPFNRGALFTHNEIEAYIRQMKLKHNEAFFQPCTNITIMRRVFGELIELHQQQGNLEKVEELKKLASAL
jgi:regulator of sirC expression with transglutaminase-like and TPR domain